MWMILSKGRKPKKQALLEALAEEDEQILALAYAHAKYLKLYGIDIEHTLYTATQNAESLSKAYQKGYYDAMDCVQNATNGDVIKAMFPNVEIIPDKYTPSVDLSVGGIMMMRVDRNWWNAKYKGVR